MKYPTAASVVWPARTAYTYTDQLTTTSAPATARRHRAPRSAISARIFPSEPVTVSATRQKNRPHTARWTITSTAPAGESSEKYRGKKPQIT